MNSQQKYDRIMEVMADKTLSVGCLISSKQFHIYEQEYVSTTIIGGTWFHNQGNVNLKRFRVLCPLTEEDIWFDFEDLTKYKIIGHPLHIGHVLEYYDFEGTEFDLLEKWKDKRLPLSPTDEELVEYIYSLLP